MNTSSSQAEGITTPREQPELPSMSALVLNIASNWARGLADYGKEMCQAGLKKLKNHQQ